jgi:hypothetical protein
MSARTSLTTCFEQLIPDDWKLERTGNYWSIEEPNAGHSLFEFGGSKSIGFSLDRGSVNAFPFCSAALGGMRKVNDGLIVGQVEGKDYVVAIEMKTSPNKKPEALRQIQSGQLFINWAIELLRLHKHYSGEYAFLGVVSVKPRKQPKKGTSQRSAELPKPESSPYGNQYPIFVLTNHPRTSFTDLVSKAFPTDHK